jgi:hypothetical protein
MGLHQWCRCWVRTTLSGLGSEAHAIRSHWMRANLKRVAKTFRRPILGVHNRSYGILFDVVESCLQRTLSYPTLDIRTAYEKIHELLQDPDVSKLVLIAHSQGAIEAGMVLDWCFATVPHANIAKVELYTFGNASNRCNSPMDVAGRRIVQHIEHYVHRWDWVSRFGILKFRGIEYNQPQSVREQDGKSHPSWNSSLTYRVSSETICRQTVYQICKRPPDESTLPGQHLHHERRRRQRFSE